jgi:tetratricopeptide (TPR) repeat protein
MFALSGTFFGLLIGWILGTERQPPPAAAPAAATASAAPSDPSGSEPPAPPLDEQKATQLEDTAKREPANAAVRVELANLYYDSAKYDQAITWYEAALRLDPKNVDASTDLGLAYYFTNQIDRALAQFDTSLTLDPKHLKTLLNQGVVLAFGKQDLQGAMKSWQRVVDIAPDSDEGKTAKKALADLASGHANLSGGGGRSGGQ